MSYDDLLIDSCTIQTRTVNTSGMEDTESWANQASATRCRVLKNSATLFDANKAQHATVIRTRFALPLSATITIRDRILYESRAYSVIEVLTTRDEDGTHHKVAVCESVAGGV